jgi:hypothetical protein
VNTNLVSGNLNGDTLAGLLGGRMLLLGQGLPSIAHRGLSPSRHELANGVATDAPQSPEQGVAPRPVSGWAGPYKPPAKKYKPTLQNATENTTKQYRKPPSESYGKLSKLAGES